MLPPSPKSSIAGSRNSVPRVRRNRGPTIPEDHVVYDPVQILREHQQLRQQFGAKLIWAGDWTTYDGSDFWVTVVPQAFGDSSGALNWCSSNGRDRDHCSAQIVSKTLGPNGTHAN